MWPRCPDAPIIVPLGPGTGLVVELDRLVFTELRDGVPVVPQGPAGLPMAALRVVAPGELTDLRKPLRVEPPEFARSGMKAFGVDNGPAVRIRANEDLFIPAPDAHALAAEIERRRRRVVELGGFAAQEVWARAPSLRTSTAEPVEPPTLARGTWRPLPMPAVGAPSPGMEITASAVQADLPYPEQLRDYEADGLAVTTHALTLGGALTVPLAAWHVVRAGRLTDVPSRWALRWFTTREIRLDLVDGPAVWLWGPTAEWLVCTPNAEALAADIRLRRAVSTRFPISSDLGPERRTWHDYPLTKPVDAPRGRTPPPTPAHTPAQPTIVPPNTFS